MCQQSLTWNWIDTVTDFSWWWRMSSPVLLHRYQIALYQIRRRPSSSNVIWWLLSNYFSKCSIACLCRLFCTIMWLHIKTPISLLLYFYLWINFFVPRGTTLLNLSMKRWLEGQQEERLETSPLLPWRNEYWNGIVMAHKKATVLLVVHVDGARKWPRHAPIISGLKITFSFVEPTTIMSSVPFIAA